MAWRTAYHPERGVIETVYGDELSPADLQAAFNATLTLGRRHSAIRYLSDCRDLRGGHGVFDLYGLMKYLLAVGVPVGFKEALLVTGGEDARIATDVEFWRTACDNRGIDVRIFKDRTQALNWLAE